MTADVVIILTDVAAVAFIAVTLPRAVAGGTACVAAFRQADVAKRATPARIALA